jgi:predicted Zn-ribbon and HTH transcriptional regulator
MPRWNPDNLARLHRDAAAVVRRLLSGRSTIAREKARYGVGKPSVMTLYHARTTRAERLAAWHRQRTSPAMARLYADASVVLPRLLAGARVKQVAAEYGVPHCRVQDWYERSVPAAARSKAHARKRAESNAKRAPVGAVVVRKINGRPTRLVKVRDAGPQYGRWMPARRLAWERTHGPVPAGCRVVPLGDSLDDALANLACVTPAEVLARRLSDPAVRDRQTVQRRAAIARRTVDLRAVAAARRETDESGVPVPTCSACGFAAEGGRPVRCPKCGASAFDVVRRPAGTVIERPTGLALFLRELEAVA